MISPFTAAAIAVALISNAAACIPFIRSLRKRVWPRACEFGAVSILLYYSLGLISELMQPEAIGEILPIFRQPESDCLIALALIAVAPWMLHLGARFSLPRYRGRDVRAKFDIPAKRRRLILFLCCCLCFGIAAQGIVAFLNTPFIWTLRKQTGEAWGPWIIWFYIPLAVLIFFVSTTELKKRSGKILGALMVLASLCAALPIGERTLFLVPLLVIFAFARGLSLRSAVFFPALALAGAALLLPVFKWQFSSDDATASFSDMFWSTIPGDVSRAGVLGYTIERSDAIGTRVLPYPMSGYVYTALLFVPREAAPFKGDSTAQRFTADMSNSKPGEVEWGYGIGLIEESVLNGGILLCLPILFGYGAVLGICDRIRNPVFILPIRLIALWLGGYHLAAMLQTFGPALLVALLFVCPSRQRLVPLSARKRRIVPQAPCLFPESVRTDLA